MKFVQFATAATFALALSFPVITAMQRVSVAQDNGAVIAAHVGTSASYHVAAGEASGNRTS